MSCSCCNIESISEEQSDVCPTCYEKGKSVGNFTINSLVNSSRAREGGYPDGHYCANPNCDTIYFFEDEIEPISKDDLSVTVGFKENKGPQMVCYCYEHTAEAIQADFKKHGESTIEAQIREEVKSGSCSCEAKNPQGRCCLGDVRAAYGELKFADSVMG